MSQEFNCVEDIEKKYNFKFSGNDKKYNDIILNIFNNKIVFKNTYPADILNIFGIYYWHHNKNIENMQKCFHIAISKNVDQAKLNMAFYYYSINEYAKSIYYIENIAEKGNTQAITLILKNYKQMIKNVAFQYRNQIIQSIKKYCDIAIKINFMDPVLFMTKFYIEEKQYEDAKQYFQMLVNANYVEGIRNFAIYYWKIEQNNDQVKILFQKAIDLGDTTSIICLAKYYQEVENDIDKMKETYQQGIAIGNIICMHNLATYYQEVEKNYDQAENIYIQASNIGCIKSTHNLALLYKSQNKESLMLKYYFICLKNHYASAIFELLTYYKSINRNDLVEKCSIYHIKSKTSNAYLQLGNYYLLTKNYAKMHKYYVKAFNLPNYKCPIDNRIMNVKANVMKFLGLYYVSIKNYKASERCLLSAFKYDTGLVTNVACMLGKLYEEYLNNYDLMKKYYNIAITQDNDVNALNAMLKYYVDIESVPQAMWFYYKLGLSLNIDFDRDIVKNYIISNLVSSGKTEECMICYQEKEIHYSDCEQHGMCVDCSVRLYLQPCPYCRKRKHED